MSTIAIGTGNCTVWAIVDQTPEEIEAMAGQVRRRMVLAYSTRKGEGEYIPGVGIRHAGGQLTLGAAPSLAWEYPMQIGRCRLFDIVEG